VPVCSLVAARRLEPRSCLCRTLPRHRASQGRQVEVPCHPAGGRKRRAAVLAREEERRTFRTVANRIMAPPLGPAPTPVLGGGCWPAS
jgi:hypothetical protein